MRQCAILDIAILEIVRYDKQSCAQQVVVPVNRRWMKKWSSWCRLQMLVVVQVAGEEKSLASSGTGPWPASLGLAWIVTNSFGGGKWSSFKLVAQSGLASASGRLGAATWCAT